MDLTTTEAAEYLAQRGYTVKRRRVGGKGPPTADTIKHWCGKRLPARKAKGGGWLIAQEALDRLIEEGAKGNESS